LNRSNLFLVPGNHDLDRDKLRYLTPFLTLLPNRDQVIEELSNPETRANFLAPMQAYAKFCSTYLSPAGAAAAYAQLHQFVAAGRSVGILGLNSAWMCGQKMEGSDISDYGHLILGETQMNQHFDKWKKADVRMAVMHHPFEWFSTVEDRGRLRRALTQACHFLLRGHEHDPEVTVLAAGTAGGSAIFSAGAAYDRRDSTFRPNGYNFVYLDFEQGQGTVYLRRYDSDQRKFIANSSVTGDETPGIASFVLPGELGKTYLKDASVHGRKTPAGKGNNRGMTIGEAVTGDLWAVQNPTTMRSVRDIYRAQHADSSIKRVSAALIVQANSLRDESEPDLITLEQVFQPLDEPIYCIKLSMFSSLGDFLGQSKWSLSEVKTGTPVRTIALPTYEIGSVPTAEDGPSPRALVIHFDPVLRVGTGPFRLEYREWVRNGLASLREGQDELFVNLSRSRQPVPNVILILKVPASFGKVEMRASTRTNAMNPGSALSERDLQKFDDLPGFYPIGWQGTNVGSDETFAVDLIKLP
jgi:hypothetical protein